MIGLVRRVKDLMWHKKRRRYHNKEKESEYYSVSNKLRSENKTNDVFESMLSLLTLEEVIALRLELAAKAVHGNLYGLQLWKSIPKITKDALLKYAYSAARTNNEAASFLGLSRNEFRKYIKKFNIKNYFKINN